MDKEEINTSAPRTYTPGARTIDLVDKAFVLNRPSEEQGFRLDAIRARGRDYAKFLATHCPESAELTLALRALHQASQHAVTAILFNEEVSRG